MDWYDWYDLVMDHELAIEYNWRRERWPESQLPKGLYSGSSEESSELDSWDSKVKVMRLFVADEGEMLYWKETYLG